MNPRARSSCALLVVFATAAACSDPRDDAAAPPAPEVPDLAALAQSPEVMSRNYPFANAPRSDQARHVTMSDGTRIAVNLYFPAGFDPATGKAPAIFVDSWYGRANEAVGEPIDLYRAGGFVVVLGDSRGFAASFGSQPSFMSPEARRDQTELVDWIAAQPWSNGSVAAVGISLSAVLAEMVTASRPANLRASIIRASDFDQYATNLYPGGVPNLNMLEAVAGITQQARGEACVRDLAACARLGFQPVDGDTDLQLLQAALREHASNADGTAPARATFADDAIGSGSWADFSPAGQVAALDQGRIPARVSASWMDGATAAGALERFARAPSAPMEVVIGVTNHLGGLDAEPFSNQPFAPARVPPAESFGADVTFLKRVLSGEPVARTVTYFVMGADTWKTTAEWPPAGTRRQLLHFSNDALLPEMTMPRGRISYRVDPTTSSGPFNRWASQRNGPVFYGDGRRMPGRRLELDGPPMTADMELVGAPELCLVFHMEWPDGLVVAYLQDVAPDGRVTHLTEGQLRLVHRKTEGTACDPAPGTKRSFKRADGAPVPPGEVMRVEIPLQPTAALIRRGHRLRLALAGADAGTFPMLSEAPATWYVLHGDTDGSTLLVPMRTWGN